MCAAQIRGSPRTTVRSELLAAAAATLLLAVVFAPPRVVRASLLTWGVAGLAGMAAIALAPSLDLVKQQGA